MVRTKQVARKTILRPDKVLSAKRAAKSAVRKDELPKPQPKKARLFRPGRCATATRHVHGTRTGAKALQEIRRLQKSTELLIPFLPFSRLVREIAQQYRRGLRFQTAAILAMQVSEHVYTVRMKRTGSGRSLPHQHV
jgi:histone H3